MKTIDKILIGLSKEPNRLTKYILRKLLNNQIKQLLNVKTY